MIEATVQSIPKRAYPRITIPRFIPAVVVSETDIEEYVIKCDLFDRFPQGSVVHGYELPIGTDIERRCMEGSLRPAMEHEKGKEYVDIEDTLRPGVGLTDQLNEANETKVKQAAEIQKLKSDLHNAVESKSAKYDPEKDNKNEVRWGMMNGAIKNLDKQVKERDEIIDSLRRQLNEKLAPTPTKTGK